MNRRNFLQLATLAVAGQAAERVWPFRVYSIPKKIVAACGPCLTTEIFRRSAKRIMEAGGRPKELFVPLRVPEKFYESDIIMDAVPYSLMQLLSKRAAVHRPVVWPRPHPVHPRLLNSSRLPQLNLQRGKMWPMAEPNLTIPPFKPEYEGLTLAELKVRFPNEKWPDFTPPRFVQVSRDSDTFQGLARSGRKLKSK